MIDRDYEQATDEHRKKGREVSPHEKLIASVQAEVQFYEREAAQAKLRAHATSLLVLLLQDLRERSDDFRIPNKWWHGPCPGALWNLGYRVLVATVYPDIQSGLAFVGEIRVDGLDVVRFETGCAAVLADWILLRLREAERRSP